MGIICAEKTFMSLSDAYVDIQTLPLTLNSIMAIQFCKISEKLYFIPFKDLNIFLQPINAIFSNRICGSSAYGSLLDHTVFQSYHFTDEKLRPEGIKASQRQI